MGAHDILGLLTADGGDVIAAAGYSDNFIDLVEAIPKIGVGQHSPMLCIRSVLGSGADSDSLSIELRVSATNDGTDLDGTPKTVMMPLAGIASGAGENEVLGSDARLKTAGEWIFRGQLPYGVNLRYMQLYFNNSTSAQTFKIEAWLEDAAASDFRGSQVLFSGVSQP